MASRMNKRKAPRHVDSEEIEKTEEIEEKLVSPLPIEMSEDVVEVPKELEKLATSKKIWAGSKNLLLMVLFSLLILMLIFY